MSASRRRVVALRSVLCIALRLGLASGFVSGFLAGCGALHAIQGDRYRLSEECSDEHAKPQEQDAVCDMLMYDRLPTELELGKARATRLDDALFLVSFNGASGTRLAYAFDLAGRLEPAAVAEATTAVSEVTRRLFLDRFAAVRTWVLERVEYLGPHWHDVYLEPVLAARRSWAESSARKAPWLRKAAAAAARVDEAIVAHTVSRDLIDELAALRASYVEACREDGAGLEACLGDEVAWPLSRSTRELAKTIGDAILASAEDRLLVVPNLSRLEYVEHRAAAAALRAEAREHAEWQALGARGRETEAARRRWKVEPIDTSHDEVSFGDPGGDGHGGISGERLQLARVEPRGAEAVLTFRRNVVEIHRDTGCHETDKVDRIEDGRVIYREVCTGEATRKEDQTPAPARIPLAEARALRKHDVVTLVLDDDRRGYLVEAHRGDETLPPRLTAHDQVGALIQIRAFRVELE